LTAATKAATNITKANVIPAAPIIGIGGSMRFAPSAGTASTYPSWPYQPAPRGSRARQRPELRLRIVGKQAHDAGRKTIDAMLDRCAVSQA
jgi:hypothetical protein